MAQQARDEAGNIWDVTDPNNPVFVSAGGAASDMGVVAPNPMQVERQRLDAANAALSGQRTAQQIAQDAATAPLDREKTALDVESTRLANEKSRRELAAPPKQAQETTDRMSRLMQLAQQVGRTQALYNSGIGTTKGLAGLQDYLPTGNNARFDVAGASLSQQGLAAFRVPGTGTVSDRDAMMFDRANLPTASTRDAAIEEQLRSIRTRVDEEMKALGRQPLDWGAITREQGGDGRRDDSAPVVGVGGNTPPTGGYNGPAGYDVAGVSGGVSGGPSGAGSTFASAAGVAMAAKLKDAYNAGAGVAELNKLLADNGFQQFRDPQAIEAIQKRGPLNFAPPAIDDTRGGVGRALGAVADSVGGAYAISAADALTAGNLDSLAGGTAGLAQDYAQQQYPGASLLGSVTGGALAAGGAELAAGGLAARAGLSAASPWVSRGADAAYGAAYGAGSADNPNESRLLGAAAGGLGGLAGGEIGRRGIDLAGRFARGRFGLPSEAPVTRGQNIAVDALGSDNLTPYQAVRTVREANQLGVPAIPADLGDNARGTFSSLARQPGPERATLRESVINRQMGQGDRIRSAITEDLGPITNIRQQSEALANQAKAAAGPLYDQAYSAAGASSVPLDDLLQRPSMRSGLANARTIAAEEGRDPTTLGFDFDAEGNTVLTRVPSFQTLDYVKRGVDDVIEQSRDPVTGRLNLDTRGRAANSTLRDFISRVDAVNPAYAQARKAYAGPAAEKAALQDGRKALNMSAEDVEAIAARLSPAQRQQFGLGYRTALSDAIDARVDGADKVGALVGTPKKRGILGQVTGNAEGFGRFNQRLDAERAANETYRAVATGSPTASRLADDNIIGNEQAMANRIIAAGQGFRSGGLTGGAIGLGLDALKNFTTYGLGKKAAVARADAAQVLLDPKALEEVANTLGRNKAVRRVNDRAIARALERPRQYGGIFGAPLLPYLVSTD